MAKLTYLELTNRILRRITQADITDVTTATGQALLITNFLNEAQNVLFNEENWHSLYTSRTFVTADGTAEYAVASGALVAIKLRNADGTHEIAAAGAFDVDATLYGAADGKVDDATSGSAIGKAVEAALADGDIVETVEFAVLSTIAANVSIADAGNHTAMGRMVLLK